jgi:hypothetical protein
MRRVLIVTLAIVAAAAVTGWFDGSTPPGDAALFARAGTTMLSGAWEHTYGDPAVQAGPLELGLVAAANHAGQTQRGFAIMLEVVGALALMLVAASFLGRRARPLALFGLGVLVLGIVGDMYVGGHPAELFIGLLWLLAAREAHAERTLLAGTIVGLSAGFEVWGILGLTVLALTPRLRRFIPAAAAAVALAAALYLPFAVGGDFRMLDYHWVVMRGIDARLLGVGHPFTWPMRVIEGAIVVGFGVAVARGTRRLTASIWLVPAATSLCRIVLDPVQYGIYWDTALILILIGATGILAAPRQLAAQLRSAAEQRKGAQRDPRDSALLTGVREVALQKPLDAPPDERAARHAPGRARPAVDRLL